MSDLLLPDDFPRPHHLGAVPGVQRKFLAIEYEGRYYSPGCTPPELFERWQHCMHLVPQFVSSCIAKKAGKRKNMSKVGILDQYLQRLIESGWVSNAEARWVISEAARQLDWPMSEAGYDR